MLIFFFFQAEDGIRDHCVTGVQTCALPICCHRLDSWQYEHLLPTTALDLARVEPQRVANHEPLRLEHAPAATGEAHVDPEPPRPASGNRHGPAEQRLQQLASRGRQQAAPDLYPQRIRLLL